MKSDKFRIQSLPPFPGTLDPQRTLQRLREHTADGCEAEHKKGWVILNREALVKTFVTDRYRPAHQSSSACVKVKEQITAMTEMYYDFVVCVQACTGRLEQGRPHSFIVSANEARGKTWHACSSSE